MKKLLFFLIFNFFANVAHSQTGYEIIVNLKNSNDTIAYLTYYQFDKTYIKDTCYVAKNRQFIFKGKTKLDTGIYSIVSQQKTIYFDFFVDEQNQKLEFKNELEPNNILGLNVLNSPSQNNFIDYLKFVSNQIIKVVSVYTMHDGEKFLKYSMEKGLNDWINVYDGVYINNLVNKYDIYSTPVIYILDKNKTIKAKRIGLDQIKNFINSTNQ